MSRDPGPARRLRIGPLLPRPPLRQGRLPLDLVIPEPEPVEVLISAEAVRALAASGLGLRVLLPAGVQPVAVEAISPRTGRPPGDDEPGGDGRTPDTTS